MHGSAASAVAAGGLAGQFGQQQLGRNALGQRVAVAAVRAGDPVVPPRWAMTPTAVASSPI